MAVSACLASATSYRFCTKTARDDDLAVDVQGVANRVQAFLDGFIDETAGVDDDEVSAFESLTGLVALGRQLREDQLRIGQGLGAAERSERHFGNIGHLGRHL